MAFERTERHIGIYGTGDASTRRIRIVGLTRRAETDVHAYRVTGNEKKIMGRVASCPSASSPLRKIIHNL
jgi:hypothetical protein